MKTVLVTGGAGFVGSQTVLHLQDHGYRVVVIDDLSTGHRQFGLHADRFYEGCVEDTALLDQVLVDESVDGVIHCAARALVEESTREPVAYFQANVGNFGVLLDALVRHGTRPVVFSSSATVYGAPDEVPIEENTRTLPINPYGESKLAAERLLAACGTSYGLPGLSLRYFNAAGADAACRVGEWRRHETHAIPNLIAAGLDGNTFTVCGADWPTPDGSCIRDFIHTEDLARAHRLGLEYLWAGGESTALNLGSGNGISVLELAQLVSKVLQAEIHLEIAPRRPGDAAVLTAQTIRAREVLGFVAQRSSIQQIIEDAVAWALALRNRHQD